MIVLVIGLTGLLFLLLTRVAGWTFERAPIWLKPFVAVYWLLWPLTLLMTIYGIGRVIGVIDDPNALEDEQTITVVIEDEQCTFYSDSGSPLADGSVVDVTSDTLALEGKRSSLRSVGIEVAGSPAHRTREGEGFYRDFIYREFSFEPGESMSVRCEPSLVGGETQPHPESIELVRS